MVKLIRQGVYFMEDRLVKENRAFMTSDKKERAVRNTVSYEILSRHGRLGGEGWTLKPDHVSMSGPEAVCTLRAADRAGVKKFPVDTVVFSMGDGDRAQDDFLFSAAKKFGGEFVPSLYLCTEEAYLRENKAVSGEIVLSGDSALLGALGALCFADSDPLGSHFRALRTGSVVCNAAETVAVYLKGKLRKGVGATDVVLAICRAAEVCDFAFGKILEVFGPALANLSMDMRNAIDAKFDCLGVEATVWATDEKTKEYFAAHGRENAFRALAPVQPAYYDGGIVVDLSRVEPMIRANGEIRTVEEYLGEFGETAIAGGVTTGLTGDYETIAEVAEILRGSKLGPGLSLSLSPASRSVLLALADGGYFSALVQAGADFDSEGAVYEGTATDGYASDEADVAFELDARTIAVSLKNGGVLTSALEADYNRRIKKYKFDPAPYEARVYRGGIADTQLAYGEIPPIGELLPLPEHLLLRVNGEEGAKLPEDFALPKGTETADLILRGWAPDKSASLAFREMGARAVLWSEPEESGAENVAEWGLLPLVCAKSGLKDGDLVFLENVRASLAAGEERVLAKVFSKRKSRDLPVEFAKMTREQAVAILSGCMLEAEREAR